MGIVLANTAISIDGFIAGPHHEMDWVFDHAFLPEGPISLVEGVIATTGAILTGRGTYGVGEGSTRDETSAAFGARWSGEAFVLTHRPPSQPPRPGLTFFSGDIREAVATARAAAGDKNLLVLGANVTQQCVAADLIDEILLLVLPILLGDGIRLFGRPGSARSCSRLSRRCSSARPLRSTSAGAADPAAMSCASSVVLRNVTWIDLPTSHWPVWLRPRELAQILGNVARSASAQQA